MANIVDLAWSLVATAPSPATTGLSLIVTGGDGALFANTPMKALACPPGVIPTKANSERVLITGRSTDTLTIVRDNGNYNGGVGRSIAAGWIIMQTPFADDFFNSALVTGEVPTGAINGTNLAYTTASIFRTNSLRVYVNGQRQTPGASADYQENASGNGFSFNAGLAPATGDVLFVDYQTGDSVYSVGGNSIISDEVPTGTKNGVNTQFTTARAYIPNTLEVYVNGVKQIRTTHITETTPASGIFNLDFAPASTDIVTVNYQFNLNPSSNADTVDGVHASDYGDQNGVLVADYGGWRKVLAAPTYVSATTFTVPGDLTGVFGTGLGAKLKLTNSGSKFFYVVSSSYSAGTGLTTVTVFGGSDYSLANASITNLQISYQITPQGFPTFFNFVPVWTNLTVGNGTVVARLSVMAKQVTMIVEITFGTTTSISGTVSFTLPLAPNARYVAGSGSGKVQGGTLYAEDNGVAGYELVANINNTSCAIFVTNATGTYVGVIAMASTVPFTWGSTDFFGGTITYEGL